MPGRYAALEEVETGDSPLSVWLAAVAKSESSGFKWEPSGRTPDKNHLVSINTSTDRCSYVHARHTHAYRKEIRLTTKTKTHVLVGNSAVNAWKTTPRRQRQVGRKSKERECNTLQQDDGL